MITPGQVEEWISEVKQKPESAALIIRTIAQRLSELVEKNEELLSENIGLRSGEKVEAYESRISILEYQLEMLKRQVGDLPEAPEILDTLSLFVYDTGGRVLHVTLEPDNLISGGTVANLRAIQSQPQLKLLIVNSKEELLIMFDSGRTTTMPAAGIPAVDGVALEWEQATIRRAARRGRTGDDLTHREDGIIRLLYPNQPQRLYQEGARILSGDLYRQGKRGDGCALAPGSDLQPGFMR